MLFGPDTDQDDLVAASPVDLIDASFPPTIVLHGAADRLYPFRSSIALHQRLTELGVYSDLHLYADRDHAFERAPSMTAATADAVRSFLERTVIDKTGSDTEALRTRSHPAVPSNGAADWRRVPRRRRRPVIHLGVGSRRCWASRRCSSRWPAPWHSGGRGSPSTNPILR